MNSGIMLNDMKQTRVNRELLENALNEALDNGRNAFLNLVKEESLCRFPLSGGGYKKNGYKI